MPGTYIRQRTGRYLARVWADTWITEILASVLSVCCIAALIVLLIMANGKPLQAWAGFTLNTLASILSTAAKASAMFSLTSAISQWR